MLRRVDIPVAVSCDVRSDGPGWLLCVKPLVLVIEVIRGVSPQIGGKFRISGFGGHLAERPQVVLSNSSREVIVDLLIHALGAVLSETISAGLFAPGRFEHRAGRRSSFPASTAGRSEIASSTPGLSFLTGLGQEKDAPAFTPAMNNRCLCWGTPNCQEGRMRVWTSYSASSIASTICRKTMESSPRHQIRDVLHQYERRVELSHESQESLPQVFSLVFLGPHSLLNQRTNLAAASS